MKPDDMHAAVEEVDIDPCDLYTDLGSLIVEGRVPGLTDKGFGEGPHCPSTHGQNRHQCDPANPQCQKYEQILKHMLLLWKNGIPMTIEVLLYPSCCVPSQNVESVPDMSYLLLEQWTIHMLPKRMPDASISPRGLIQAVRSFLYFSQLCAWFSLTGGESPKNVHYRICVPGEAFSSKFSCQPDCHIFPVANVGRNTAMKVHMKTHPRCGEIPSLKPCHKHPSPIVHPLLLKTKGCFASSSSGGKRQAGTESETISGRQHLSSVVAKSSSPAESMLGESLLDPPNALCMYTKRYQSPSRCGSPSIEVPEHLMFGKRGEEKCPPPPVPATPPRRSRPQRRPVVERFLKRNVLDDALEKSTVDVVAPCRTFNKRTTTSATKETKTPLLGMDYSAGELKVLRDYSDATELDVLAIKKEDVISYSCSIEDCMKNVPREEMEQVLERLCERNSGPSKCGPGCHSRNKNKSLSHLIDEMKINSGLVEENGNDNELRRKFCKGSDLLDSKNLFKQALRLNKESSNRKFDKGNVKSTSSSFEALSSFPKVHINRTGVVQRNTKEQIEANQLLTNKLNELQSLTYFHSQNEGRLFGSLEKSASSSGEQSPAEPYHHHHCHTYDSGRYPASQVHPKFSVNIKKCGALLAKSDNNNSELNDEREISPKAWIESLEGDIPQTPLIIPSAEKKALFRRSLDSATSLVFHQRSGLPLTSSPAPVRKCGTCFDFDSSLTSVSAIKRALFEKDLEEEKIEEQENLSTSAPASITSSSLLGTFEESVLNGRLEPVSTVEGFTAEIGASGSFCPRHITLPVTVFFYTLQDMDKVTSPYMGHINLRDRDYHIPKKGTVQVTLFNPHRTVVKMFVVRYDLSDMPVHCQTFLRQRTLYMPADARESDPDAQKWLRYLIHLRFMSSKSGRIYLHTDVRVIIFRKSDLDAATVHGQRPYELRSFTHGPLNPKFSSHKP